MSEDTPGDELLYEVRGDVARITFNRPQARNALTYAMYERLAEVCGEASEDPAVRAVVLTGAGEKAFAAGTDISQFRQMKTAQDALDYEARIDGALNALETCRKPTLAAISGACTGGGAAIAACCDLRIAAANMRMGFPVARTLGNCISMSNYARLASLIGPARTKDIIFTSRLVEAQESREIGLVSEIVEDHAALVARADELAALLAGQAPLTLYATKEALRRLRPKLGPTEGHDLVVMCYMSEDFREGIEAFLGKRKPQWKGK